MRTLLVLALAFGASMTVPAAETTPIVPSLQEVVPVLPPIAATKPAVDLSKPSTDRKSVV